MYKEQPKASITIPQAKELPLEPAESETCTFLGLDINAALYEVTVDVLHPGHLEPTYGGSVASVDPRAVGLRAGDLVLFAGTEVRTWVRQ